MAGNGKVGNLFFGINLDSKEFKKGMRQVKRNMKQFQKDMKNGFADVAKGATALTAGITGLTAGAFALAKQTSELVNSQNILAESLGSTQAEIAGLELAADTMGVSYDMLIDKMREFGGVDEFKKLADDVMNAGDATAQLAKAQEIFGNEGLKLLPILQQGSQGLNDYVTEARKLGLALSPDQVDQMTGAWGKFEKAMQKITGLTRQLGLIFSESFGEFSEKIGELISNNLPALVANVDVVWKAFQNWFNNMIMGIEYTLDAFADFTDGVSDEFSAIELLVFALESPFEAFSLFLASWAETTLSVMSSPFRGFVNLVSRIFSGFTVLLETIVTGWAKIFEGIISSLPKGFTEGSDIKSVAEALNRMKGSIAGVRKEVEEFGEAMDPKNFTGAYDDLLLTKDKRKEFESLLDKSVDRTRRRMARVMGDISKMGKSETGAESGKADASSKISGMATLAVAGSIEAFKLENQTENQILDVNKKQLIALNKMTRQQQLQVAGFTK